jgi:hypothetical protein
LIFSGSSVARGGEYEGDEPSRQTDGLCRVPHRLDKDLGTYHDQHQGEECLGDDGPCRRRRPEAPKRKGLRDLLQHAAGVEGSIDIVRVGGDQDGGEPDPHEQG